jgi:hypothetical protein
MRLRQIIVLRRGRVGRLPFSAVGYSGVWLGFFLSAAGGLVSFRSRGACEHLGKLSRAELRVIWEREFREEPPATLGRDILALGIAYVRQERRYGGLAKPVARELDRLLTRVLGDVGTDIPKTPTAPLPRTGKGVAYPGEQPR